MPLTVYYTEASPPARSVNLVIHALELSAEYKNIDLFAKEHLEPEFLKINPFHTIPTIDDDGFILWESRAIMTYLVSKYGKDDSLYPKEIQKRALVDQKLHNSHDAFTILKEITRSILFFNVKTIPEDLLKKVQEAQENVEKLIGDKDFIAGNSLTVADYSYITLVDVLAVYVPTEDKYPHTSKWMARCKTVMKDFEEVNEKGAQILINTIKENLSS